MAQRGRKSAASLTVARSVEAMPRLAPPPELSDYEASTWQQVTATKPADWFQADTLPLLVAYCKHVGTAAAIDQQLAKFSPKWLDDDEGLDRFKKLTDMRDKQSRAITMLARSMRLTQQAQYHPDKAGTHSKKVSKSKPWQS